VKKREDVHEVEAAGSAVALAADEERQYHHGDLRRELLDAARELLVERGVPGFSLRETARRAGVSPRAPYHHFVDRSSLLSEVAREGFARMQELMAVAASETDPRRRLQLLGEAYVRFAAESPADFQTMHCDELCRPEVFPDRSEVAERPFQYVVETLQEIAGRPLPEEELEQLAMVAWTTVHGLACLRAEGVLEVNFQETAKREAMIHAVIERITVMLVAETERLGRK
jgi:AcrR family transcriptional regulator